MKKALSEDYFQQKGVTAEKVVHDLASKTFLVDWCFLNPKLPNGKELCDLLVVFDNTAIIWQIKDLKIGRDGKYKISDLEKNLRQLSGARRQLFDLNTPITLENARRCKEVFDPTKIENIFLISVVLGEGQEYFSFVDEIKNYKVHVFTRDFVQTILTELDTVSDFVTYLKAKEMLIADGKSIAIVGGEEELLAYYLLNGRDFKEFLAAASILLDNGHWDHLHRRPEYSAKKQEDKISYIWDEMINQAHEGGEEYEPVARELARLNRFQRRFLSKTFVEAHMMAHNDKKYNQFRRVMVYDKLTYCFLFQDTSEPRDCRKAALGALCLVARGLVEQNALVLGIATEKEISLGYSFDFCLLELPKLTKDILDQIAFIKKEYGIMTNPTIKRAEEDEYPKQNSHLTR